MTSKQIQNLLSPAGGTSSIIDSMNFAADKSGASSSTDNSQEGYLQSKVGLRMLTPTNGNIYLTNQKGQLTYIKIINKDQKKINLLSEDIG